MLQLLQRRQAWLLSFFLLLSFSCHIRLVPTYNPELEQQISDAAKATDKLFLQIIDADNDGQRVYSSFKDSYLQIETEINSIELKNQARDKNANFLAIIDNLKKAFTEAKEYHHKNDTLKAGEAKAYQATLAGFWAPLYVAEMALKDPRSSQ